jgi:thiamine-monophosphate kinase
VVGGDTARAGSVLLSVTALGDLAGRPPVRRSGAAAGDVVAVAGALGHSAAGYALLRAGVTTRCAELIAAHRRPAPPYEAGPEAALLGASAMIDVSDGLLADLGHVAAASGVLVNVESSRLALGDPLAEAAALVLAAGPSSSRTSPAGSPPSLALNWALTGGEDHSLIAAFPPATALPPRWRVIGAVQGGHGVTVDGNPYEGPAGWEHFR